MDECVIIRHGCVCNTLKMCQENSESGHYAYLSEEDFIMERIKTLTETTYQETQEHGGCGECQTSCQSACKTSCTVGNQSCENQ